MADNNKNALYITDILVLSAVHLIFIDNLFEQHHSEKSIFRILKEQSE